MTWHRPNSTAGRITSPFGDRVAPYPGASTYHLGVDLRAGVYGVDGSIYAAQDGVVSSRYITPMGAQVVVIDHGAGVKTYYVHMPADGIYVVKGQRVTGGQRIAIAGKTGAATVHLHFETRVNGSAVDPVPFMKARGVDLTIVTVSDGTSTPTAPTIPSLPGAPAPITPEDDMTPEQSVKLDRAVEIGEALVKYILDEKGRGRQADDRVLGALPNRRFPTKEDGSPGPLAMVLDQLDGQVLRDDIASVSLALTDEQVAALAAFVGPEVADVLAAAVARELISQLGGTPG
jgi:hypothetical protein